MDMEMDMDMDTSPSASEEETERKVSESAVPNNQAEGTRLNVLFTGQRRRRPRTKAPTNTSVFVESDSDSDSNNEKTGPPASGSNNRNRLRHFEKRAALTALNDVSGERDSKRKRVDIPVSDNININININNDGNAEIETDPLDDFMNNLVTTNGKPRGSKVSATGDDNSDDEQLGTLEIEDDDGAFLSGRTAPKKKKLVYSKVDHSKVNYHAFRKDLYIEVPELARMTSEDVVQLRRALGNIRIRGKRCPKPVKSWGQCGLSHALLEQIHKSGYVTPTPIQAQGIPTVMKGRDIIGVAKTGSGKTLAFVLPLLRHIGIQARALAGDGPSALIIAPTRELVIQIYGEARKFAKCLNLRCVCAYGGSGVKDQITELKRGADLIVCTPGRMIDLLAMNSGRVTNLRRVTFVVLDEADRMFDLGFEPQLTRIIENVRPDRQTVMFSATFPRKVEELARKILKTPIEITVGGNSIVASTIDQHIEVRTEDSKFYRLLEILGTWYEKGDSTLVFVDRQESADRIFSDLSKAKYQCLPLHAGRDQADRDSAIADFKNGIVKILIATSVAARGLDVKKLSLVINFDVPNHYEDYVHRVGRTGRAGRKGTSYTFVTKEQESYASDLVKALQLAARNKSNLKLANEPEEIRKQKADEAAVAAVPNELRELAEGYERKRKAGIVVHGRNSGYGGKGFKFDGNEEYEYNKEKKALRKAQAKRFGIVDENNDEDTDEEEEVEVREISGTAAGNGGTTTVEEAKLQAKKMGLSHSEMLAKIAKAKVDAMLQSKAAAAGVSGSNSNINSNSGAAATSSNSGGEKYACELEINDYPQHARWNVTRKNALADVEEFTSCVVTTRGNFFPAGRNAPLGQRKLHLLIEGPSIPAVKSARKEIKRKLDEAAANRAAGEGGDTYAKYSVV